MKYWASVVVRCYRRLSPYDAQAKVCPYVVVKATTVAQATIIVGIPEIQRATHDSSEVTNNWSLAFVRVHFGRFVSHVRLRIKTAETIREAQCCCACDQLLNRQLPKTEIASLITTVVSKGHSNPWPRTKEHHNGHNGTHRCTDPMLTSYRGLLILSLRLLRI